MQCGSLEEIGAKVGDLVLCVAWRDSVTRWGKAEMFYRPGNVYLIECTDNEGYPCIKSGPDKFTGVWATWSIATDAPFDVKELL